MSEEQDTVSDTTADTQDASIRRAVADALGDLFSSGKATVVEGKADEEDTGAQARRAAAAVRAQRKNASVVDALKAEVSELKDTIANLTSKAAEASPVKVRRIERLMGWRLPEEDA